VIQTLLKRLGSFFRKGSEVPALPDPLNDNQYLASSANAAVADKSSGAYDKFLFSEQEVTQMPYEQAVDSHLALVSTRLDQRFSREVTQKRNVLIKAATAHDRASDKLNRNQGLLTMANEQLDDHIEVLSGKSTGKHGLFWPGKKPDMYSTLNARIRLSNRYTIFILIGLVDIYIIWSSIRNLGIPAIEAAFLTAPAVAAQLAFPHLSGTRLSRIIRGETKKVSLIIEVLILLGIWGTFVYVMAVVRVRFITDLIANETGTVDPSYATTLLLLNLVLLTALGGWLVFIAMRENPHEIEALAVQIKISQSQRRLDRSSRAKSRAQSKQDIAQNNLDSLVSEMDKAIKASRDELGSTAKAIYRRALVNQVSDAEFTAAYLQADGLSREEI